MLDAGAGIGALSYAFLRRWLAGRLACQRMAVDAVEIGGAAAGDWRRDGQVVHGLCGVWRGRCVSGHVGTGEDERASHQFLALTSTEF